jgi:hypothetical protein
VDAAPPFRIYYDGGETYDGDPWLAPALGVLVIVERDPDHGRRLIARKDFYTWRGERWWAVDHIGFYDYLIAPGPRKVIFGRMIKNEEWYDAMRRADDDPDFPTRTAWGPDEERIP